MYNFLVGNWVAVVRLGRAVWWVGITRKVFQHAQNIDLEVDGLQQQKIMLGSTPVRQEEESEAVMGTGCLKLNSLKLFTFWWACAHNSEKLQLCVKNT